MTFNPRQPKPNLNYSNDFSYQSEDSTNLNDNISNIAIPYQILFSRINDIDYDITNYEPIIFQHQSQSLFAIHSYSNISSEQRNREKRKDYLLKEFKCRCGKYIISLLNSVSPRFKFCLFDYKTFTQNVSYNDNAKWLGYTIKELLCEFDKKNHRNSKIVRKVFAKRNKNERLIELLNKTYEEVIMDYSNEQLSKDLEINQIEDVNEYKKLGGNKEGSFIYIVKYTKGNMKKK